MLHPHIRLHPLQQQIAVQQIGKGNGHLGRRVIVIEEGIAALGGIRLHGKGGLRLIQRAIGTDAVKQSAQRHHGGQHRRQPPQLTKTAQQIPQQQGQLKLSFGFRLIHL